ncbi:MAG: DUF2586 family protein [Minicystis sp.]
MSVPAANVTETPAEVGIAPSSAPNVCVFFGCSSKGPLLQPQSFGAFKAMASAFGCGPTPKLAAYANAKTGADFVFIRLPASAVAAFTSSVTKTGTGTFVATVSGTPTDNYEVVLIFTVGGTIGSAGISYKYSLDGGTTFTTPTTLGTATTITLASTGLTVNLTATQTVVTNDQITFYTMPGSQAILTRTVTRANSGSPSTATFTVSGTPEDAYELVLQVVDGGTVATAGITVRYSLDGDNTFTPKIALGTGNSIALSDGAEPSGLQVSFGAGTLDSGDQVSCKTTGPQWQASDLTTAMANLRSSNLKFSFLCGTGATDASLAGSVGGILSGWASGTKFSWAALSTRDRGSNESEAIRIARLLANFASFSDTRIAEGAGYARITCPVTGRRNRRPAMWVVVPRLIANGPQIDPGKKKLGPLSSDVSIYDASNQLVEHDARINPALHDARFVTLRTFDDEAGVFVTRGNLMGPDTDIQRIAYRRVLNIAEEVYQKAMSLQLESEFRLWSSQAKSPYKPGDIYEPDALRMEREFNAALVNQLVSTGYVSSVSVKLNRTPVSLGSGKYKLLCTVKLTGLAYIDQFEGTIGFTDPALDALINSAA